MLELREAGVAPRTITKASCPSLSGQPFLSLVARKVSVLLITNGTSDSVRNSAYLRYRPFLTAALELTVPRRDHSRDCDHRDLGKMQTPRSKYKNRVIAWLCMK